MNGMWAVFSPFLCFQHQLRGVIPTLHSTSKSALREEANQELRRISELLEAMKIIRCG